MGRTETKVPEHKAPEPRKLALVMFDAAGLISLLKEGLTFRVNGKIVEGLPSDAVAEHIFYDNQRNGWCIIVRSEEFEPVAFGLMPPTIPISIEVS